MYKLVQIHQVMGSREIIQKSIIFKEVIFIGRSHTPDLNSPAFRRHDRHLTKSLVDHDDNVRTSVNLSQCQTSNIQTTSDVSHDGCTP